MDSFDDDVMRRRMDERTEKEFQEDISQYTEKEMLWGKALRREFAERGHPCDVVESGVDNTGKIIYGRLPNCNPDKVYVFKDGSKSLYVEIKTIPEGHNRFHTFKVSAIKGCLHYGALIIVPKLDHYFIYGPKAMERMLERCSVVHNFRPFGNKPCLQPSMSFIKQAIADKLIVKRVWTDATRRFIEGIKAILIADRITNRRTGS